MKRPRPLSAIVPGITQPALGKKALVLGKLLEHWVAIAGAGIASKAMPEKVSFRKDKKGNAEATLYLSVSSADAALLEYEKGLLLEKIRMVTGESRIKTIRFVHNDHAPSGRKTMKKPPVARPLSAQESQALQSVIENIGDAELQAVLKSFGESLYSRSKG